MNPLSKKPVVSPTGRLQPVSAPNVQHIHPRTEEASRIREALAKALLASSLKVYERV